MTKETKNTRVSSIMLSGKEYEAICKAGRKEGLGKKDSLTKIVELIADGYYDDKIKHEDTRSPINFRQGREKEAKAKAKALGFGTLRDAIGAVVEYEQSEGNM